MTDPDALPVPIVEIASRHADGFRALNLAWISAGFELEPQDHLVLDDPMGTIVADGGQIFIAEEGPRVIGTCALIRKTAGAFELGKMTVAADRRGRGHGARLLAAAISWARRHGVERIELYSHSSLAPALALYRRFGFRDVPIGATDCPYEVCDVAMRLALGPPEA